MFAMLCAPDRSGKTAPFVCAPVSAISFLRRLIAVRAQNNPNDMLGTLPELLFRERPRRELRAQIFQIHLHSRHDKVHAKLPKITPYKHLMDKNSFPVFADKKAVSFVFCQFAAHQDAHDGRHHQAACPAGGIAQAMEVFDVGEEMFVHFHAVAVEFHFIFTMFALSCQSAKWFFFYIICNRHGNC